MAIAFVGIFLLIVVALMYFRKKSTGKIDGAYMSEEGTFRVKGRGNRFVIRKDDRFEFLVEDGVITACKDLTRHKDFVYYRGKEDV